MVNKALIQNNRTRVFISYKRAHPDQVLAMELYEALRQHYDVFIDKEVLAGMSWARQINEEYERADFIIVLLSKLSVQSEMVVRGIEVARDLAAKRSSKRPFILPVRVAYDERIPFPLNSYFRNATWIEWHTSADTPRVIESLRASLAQLSLVSAASPTPAQLLDLVPRGLPRAQESLPKGALRPNSHYYIMRPADTLVQDLMHRQCTSISIRGPRQFGKTSLLARAVHFRRRAAL